MGLGLRGLESLVVGFILAEEDAFAGVGVIEWVAQSGF